MDGWMDGWMDLLQQISHREIRISDLASEPCAAMLGLVEVCQEKNSVVRAGLQTILLRISFTVHRHFALVKLNDKPPADLIGRLLVAMCSHHGILD